MVLGCAALCGEAIKQRYRDALCCMWKGLGWSCSVLPSRTEFKGRGSVCFVGDGVRGVLCILFGGGGCFLFSVFCYLFWGIHRFIFFYLRKLWIVNSHYYPLLATGESVWVVLFLVFFFLFGMFTQKIFGV